jgi:cytochrome bd-type quinol oxidase subunit 2
MPLVELLPIFGGMSAPAFFLVFACAALGAPMLALVCRGAAALRSSAHLEAYARRLVRMALSCAAPAMLALALWAGLAAKRAPWLADWVRAAPSVPGLFCLAALAFCALLVAMRRRQAHDRRQDGSFGQTSIVALLAVAILFFGRSIVLPGMQQAQAVLAAPQAGALSVAPLILPDITTSPASLWPGLAALCTLSLAAAGAMSLEYLLLLRDREPFGREALAGILRLAARCTLRCALLAGAFLPFLWTRLPDLSRLPGADSSARLLLGMAAGCCGLLILTSGVVARSNRPWDRSGAIHTTVFSVWMGLTSCLSVALLCFYGS